MTDQTPDQHNSGVWKLKTEDLLELTRGDRGLALDSVSSLLVTCSVTQAYTVAKLSRQAFFSGRCLQLDYGTQTSDDNFEEPQASAMCHVLIRAFSHTIRETVCLILPHGRWSESSKTEKPTQPSSSRAASREREPWRNGSTNWSVIYHVAICNR